MITRKENVLHPGVERALYMTIDSSYQFYRNSWDSIPSLETLAREVTKSFISSFCTCIEIYDLFDYYEINNNYDLIRAVQDGEFNHLIPPRSLIEKVIIAKGYFVQDGDEYCNTPFQEVW